MAAVAPLLPGEEKKSYPYPQLAFIATPHLPAWARFDLFDAIGLPASPFYTARDIRVAWGRAFRHVYTYHGQKPNFPTFDQLTSAYNYLRTDYPARLWFAHRVLCHSYRSTWNPLVPVGSAAVFQPIPGAVAYISPNQPIPHVQVPLPPPPGPVPANPSFSRATLRALTYNDLRRRCARGAIIIGEVSGRNRTRLANPQGWTVGARYAVEATLGPSGRLIVRVVNPNMTIYGRPLVRGPGEVKTIIPKDDVELIGPFTDNLRNLKDMVIQERTHPYP